MKLIINDIKKSFALNKQNKKLTVLENVSFTVKDNELVCIVGPSGCGKTTLFNIIAGVENADSGQILINGQVVNGKTGHVGYMLQRDMLLPWRSIIDNVLLGVEIQRKRNDHTFKLAKTLLHDYGISEFANFYPNALSGGMRQKTALIRTLLLDPPILLFDEPFAHIDYESRLDLECSVYNIVKERKKTAIFITHDIEEAIAMGDRVLVMAPRPTTITAEFNIDLNLAQRTPVNTRESPNFRTYFTQIWSEFKKFTELK